MLGFGRLWKILRITKVDKIFVVFVGFVLLVSLMFWMIEPSMNSYGEAIWYSFNVITTIGFGDYTATTLPGRIGTMIIGLYGIIMVALIPGVLVSYYMDYIGNKKDETISMFLERLERLEELSKEELREISQSVKNRK